MARAITVPTQHSAGDVQRTVAFALGAAGVAVIGAGAYLGITAIKGNNDAASRCPQSPQCTDPQAIALTSDALRAADASTVMFVGGGVLLATAVGLYVMAPRERARRPIALRMGGTSLSVLGDW